MKTIIISLIAILTCAFTFSQSVVSPEWARNYSDRDSMTNIPSAIDVNGNIYVTGSVRTLNQGYNFATIKYNQAGDTLWVKNYNGTGNLDDEAVAIALDANGNIIVVGKSKNLNGDYDIVTIKYNNAGTVVFEKRYNDSVNGNDIPTDVTTDNSDNVYTVGYSKQTVNYDYYITIKYTSTGTQSYIKTYNSTTSGNCRATSILWKNNRLFVTGFAYQNTGTYSVTTQSYIASNGTTLWTSNYGIVSAIPSTPAKIVYFANNIYVSGTVGTNPNFDYSLVKYSSNNGTQQWATTYNAYGFNDFSTSMVLDNSGNIFVTGKAYNSNNLYEYHTLKYTSSGTLSWTNKYTTNLSDNAAMGTVSNKIAIDPYNMLYICGSLKAGTTSDMLLYQLTATGNMVWDITYNGQANGIDAATDMVIDAQGRIFLTGQTQNGISKFDYTTVKLSQTFVYNPIDLYNEPRQSSFDYIKNKGQLVNTNNSLIPEIKYYVPNTYPGLFFTPKRLSFVFAKIDTSAITLDTLHRIDMTFANCNQLATIFPIDTTAGYTNYFLAQCPQGITGIKGNERLFIPNIYPNIDLHYYSNNAGLKMYFVLKPGANPKDIAMLFDGQNNLQVNSNGELVITSSIGSTSFEQPHAYMVNYGQQIIPVSWQPTWQLQSSNKAIITTGTWNGPFPLVIMIDKGQGQQSQLTNCDWSTYYGGTGNDNGNAIYADAVGNVFYSGKTDSPDFPNVVGGYITTSNGIDVNAFIIKFNSSGVPQWGTYYGGTGECNALEIAINSIGNIYIVGTTTSANLPLVPLANTSLQNSQDGFIAKFNSLGNNLLFARYFGGNETDDYIRSIAIDGNDNVYFVGSTGSNSGFPITPKAGAYNQASTTAIYSIPDGFIAELNSSDILIWASYFGGNDADDFACVKIGANNQVIVSGSTLSAVAASTNVSNTPCGVPNSPTYFPDCDPGGGGYHRLWLTAALPGNYDAIIVQFNQNGALVWSTYFGGEGSEVSDPALYSTNSIAVDPTNSNIFYIVGKTQKFDNFPTTQTLGTYFQTQSFSGSSGRAYIAKFESKNLIWATLFGAGSETHANDVTVDNFHNVYMIGLTKTNTYASLSCAPALNPNTEFPKCQAIGVRFQPAYGGGSNGDAFISAFNSSNQLIWSTYHGGDATDEGYSVAYDPAFNRIYMTGSTRSTIGFPLLDPNTGNYQFNTNSGGTIYNIDSYIARFCVESLISVKEQQYVNADILIYPNPANSNINIEFVSSNENGAIEIQMFNSVGQLITKSNEKLNSSLKFTFDVSSYSKGLYLIQVSTNSNIYFKKIIIQ